MTGLANRFQLEQELRSIWCTPKFNGVVISVIIMDIDRFKHLNDGDGHGAGDLCLKQVASLVAAELRDDVDLAVRYGGEEFLLLLPAMEIMDAVHRAERIRRAIEDAAIPNDYTGMAGVVTASFGVAASTPMELSSSDLIAVADQALYAAKRNGRNQAWPPIPAGASSFVANAVDTAAPGDAPLAMRS